MLSAPIITQREIPKSLPPFMKPISACIHALVVVPCLAVGAMIAYMDDHDMGQHPHAEELKLSVANLLGEGESLSPQTREYLKGRVYLLISHGIRKEWTSNREDFGKLDFGKLDRTVLGKIRISNGAETDDALYQATLQKLRKSGE
jgi:hypothetical protein